MGHEAEAEPVFDLAKRPKEAVTGWRYYGGVAWSRRVVSEARVSREFRRHDGLIDHARKHV
jgi:hypothetical protein